jgi:hypothetical protein
MNNLHERVLTVCFVEIYGNRVYDLFQNRNSISLLEDGNGNSLLVGQSEITVTTFEQMMELIRLGMECRTTGSTEANQHSSRSHAIVQMSIRNELGGVESKFSLVDLAGSERGADTGNISKRARQEGSEINKSLLALKECIRALYIQRTHKDYSMHIPFRASKLTQILRDSFLGKNSQTSMIAIISPGSLSAEHSLNTLRYADRVKEFKNESRLESIKSPTEKQVLEPELDIVSPVVEQFDDLMFQRSLGSIDTVSMANSFSVAELVPSNLSLPVNMESHNNTPNRATNPLISELSEKKSNQALQRTITPISQIGFLFPLEPEQTDPEELFELVIQKHLESIAKLGSMSRQERALLSNSSLETTKKEYCDFMTDMIDQKIQIWASLRAEIQRLRNCI